MRKLSIIICVYNTDKKYLDECLASITAGTLGGGKDLAAEDYEILLIDDGSSLDYTDLSEKYTVRYHKTENRGIFRARLLGIELAEGEYIAFCDSDDTVTVNYHRPMLERAERDGADIVINDWAFRTERSRYYCRSDETVSGDIRLLGEECIAAFLSQRGRMHSYYVLWNKIFRGELLKRVAHEVGHVADGEVRFNYSEDALMSFYAFRYAKMVENLHTGYYFYRIHDSQSVTVASEEKLRRHIECMGVTLAEMRTGVSGAEDSSILLRDIDEWARLMSRTHYSYAKKSGYKSLYPLIKKTYGVDKLCASKASDGSAYGKTRLIGSNIEEIDRALMLAFKSGAAVDTDLEPYAERVLAGMREIGGRVDLSDKERVIIPKEEISLKRKIFHIPFVYKLGMLLFPKGSRIRAFLKRKL